MRMTTMFLGASAAASMLAYLAIWPTEDERRATLEPITHAAPTSTPPVSYQRRFEDASIDVLEAERERLEASYLASTSAALRQRRQLRWIDGLIAEQVAVVHAADARR